MIKEFKSWPGEIKLCSAMLILGVTTIITSLLYVGCALPDKPKPAIQQVQTIVVNASGRYRLIRPESIPDATGLRDIELWSKDGVDTNQYIFRRHIFSDGSYQFIRMDN